MSFRTFPPSCFQNCKIKFCSMILQFCRCGGLFDAKGNPDGFLSHFSSLRNFWLGGFSCSLTGCGPPVSVYSIRGPAVNRMFSFDARPSWRVVGEGHAPPLQGVCVCPAVGTNRQCRDCHGPCGASPGASGGTKPPQRSSPLRRQLFRKIRCGQRRRPWQPRRRQRRQPCRHAGQMPSE